MICSFGFLEAGVKKLVTAFSRLDVSCGQLQLAGQRLLEMLLCALRFIGGGEMGASGFRLLETGDDGFAGAMLGGICRPSGSLYLVGITQKFQGCSVKKAWQVTT